METNLTAAFKKKTDLDLAANALRKQGVLDLRIHQPKKRIRSIPAQIFMNDKVIDQIEIAEEYIYSLDVFVEKSRWRQAEDTIIRHGGQL
jgi:hypothetical protein